MELREHIDSLATGEGWGVGSVLGGGSSGCRRGCGAPWPLRAVPQSCAESMRIRKWLWISIPM